MDKITKMLFDGNFNVDLFRFACEDMGYDVTLPQIVWVLQLKIQMIDLDAIPIEIDAIVHESFEAEGLSSLFSRHGNNYVGISQVPKEGKKCFERIHHAIVERQQHATLDIVMGIGKSYKHLEELPSSFKEALRCITLAEYMGNEKGCYDYTEFALFNFLFGIQQTQHMKTFVEATIGPLLRYDLVNGTVFMETLRLYIENNASFVRTAEIMYTHRNTIKYRITRIQDILGKDLNNGMVRVELMNGILCYKLTC